MARKSGDVPTDLARSIMTLLEKEPANRFPSAAALVTALDTREAPAPRVSPTSSSRGSLSVWKAATIWF